MMFILVLLIYFIPFSVMANDYFPALSKDDYQKAFEKMGVDNCNDFQEKYLSRALHDKEILLVANAYDIGFCVPQDLAKAAYFYENIITLYKEIPIFHVRLGLIYEQSQPPLQDRERAKMLYQFAASYFISMAPETRETLLKRVFNGAVTDLFLEVYQKIEND